jgi:hypothetical protein
MPARMTLSEVLLHKALLTERDLARALRHQLIHGGRLGTNLVELGYVRLDDLAAVLAAQRGVPAAAPRDLLDTPPSVLEEVDPAFCVRHQVIPFRFDGRALHLAMEDPDPDRVIALADQLGRKVVPYVLPELRLHYLLERLYGVKRPGRFLRDPDGSRGEDQRRHVLEPTVSLAAASATARHLSLARLRAGIDPLSSEDVMVFPRIEELEVGGAEPALSPSEELVLLDERASADASAPPADATDVLTPREVEYQVARARSGGAIVYALTRPFLANTSASILFAVRDALAVAVLGAGHLQRPQMVPDLVVPLETSRVLSAAFHSRDCTRRPLSDDDLQILIAEYVGMPTPGEIAVMPVLLRGRVVHLLCIYSHPGSLLPASTLPDLRQLSEQVTWAYLRLIEALEEPR